MIISKESKFQSIKRIFTRKETLSILLIFLFVVIALSGMFLSPHLYQWKIIEGDIALKNVYAPYDFTYYWETDQNATKRARDKAAGSAPFVLKHDEKTESSINDKINGFFEAVMSESSVQTSDNAKIESIKSDLKIKLSDKTVRYFVEASDITGLQSIKDDVLKKIFIIGVISSEEKKKLVDKNYSSVVTINESIGSEVERDIETVIEENELEEKIDEAIQSGFRKIDKKGRMALISLILTSFEPTIKPVPEDTENLKKEILSKIAPISKAWDVEKNELIIEKGKRINARNIAQMVQLRRIFRPGITPMFCLGVIFLFIILGTLASFYLILNNMRKVLEQTKNIAIILLNLLLMIFIADFIMHSPQPTYFIPMASIGMIIALLVGFNIGFLSIIMMSFLISLLVGGGIEVMFVLFAGSVTGMFFVKGARRRSQLLLAGLFGGIAKFCAMICIGLINSLGLDFFIEDGIWCISSGILSGFIVTVLLPVFEHFFKVPTNISLLELSDLNHPLLKKLAIEAPGTYHHSIMVGNLAEAACDSINANSLKARVGAYYHDIGKIAKAEYFSENEMGSGSKHQKLSPSMSALIISKHVKDGVEIAKKYKFNQAIIDFICQHHGDSLISFFYQKALESSKNETEIKEENFRYPGPRPQTKETAIVLLADSVEASSRTLEEPTPASIRNLVKKIVNNKFIDAQLDECDLTLKDMHNIADSFVRVLMGVFHTRLEYPDDKKKESNGKVFNENKHRKSKPKKKDQSG